MGNWRFFNNLLELGRDFQVTGQWESSYDTLKYYVEHCANDTESFHAFSALDNANGGREVGDTSRYVNYREWLKSVLYLNTWEDNYFCTCVETIAGTYKDENSWLAVIKYLIQNSRCSTEHNNYLNEYNAERHAQWTTYLQSGVDTSKVHLDTTLPSLHQLGLDTLLERGNAGVPKYVPITFGNVHVSENPFDHSTDIILDLHTTAYVRFAVYDELGRNVQGEEMGHVYNPGSHAFHIDGASLPSGVYYARLSTPVGEVRTLKIVKRE